MSDKILVGDVGGTNVRFAVASKQKDGCLGIEDYIKLRGDDYPSFDEALLAYLTQSDVRIKRACFALAGPVSHGEVLLTNRRWHVSEAQLQDRLNLKDVCLINDFQAMARSVPEHNASAFEIILDGTPEPGKPIIVTGPGTGLGVATLLPAGGTDWRVLTGEGGHAAYAPGDKLEFELAGILLREYGYVSNELVASGMGLECIHKAFCEIFDRPYEQVSPQLMREKADAGDEMYDRLIAVRANTVMGSAGDLVLANGALGGVVLAGGVTERIVDYLCRPEAIARFRERGPLSRYLETCPIRLMHDPEAPLVGAAAFYMQEKAT